MSDDSTSEEQNDDQGSRSTSASFVTGRGGLSSQLALEVHVGSCWAQQHDSPILQCYQLRQYSVPAVTIIDHCCSTPPHVSEPFPYPQEMSRVDGQVNPTATQIATRVARIRGAMINSTVGTVTSQQKAPGRDPGVRGSTWVSRTRYPRPPENAIQGVVLHAIKELGDGTEKFDVPEVGELEAQWIGWRSGVDKDEPEVSGTELEKYKGLMKDVTSKVTVFYVYGGAFM